MSTATFDRHAAQRSVCLFFSFVIVSAFLTAGAVGWESTAQNAQAAVPSTQARA